MNLDAAVEESLLTGVRGSVDDHAVARVDQRLLGLGIGTELGAQAAHQFRRNIGDVHAFRNEEFAAEDGP